MNSTGVGITGGASVQYGEIGNLVSVTVAAGGTASLSYQALMTQYAGRGLVFSGSAAPETLIGTRYADTVFGGGGRNATAASFGNSGSADFAESKFIPEPSYLNPGFSPQGRLSGTGTRIKPGDLVVPVYGPRIGAAKSALRGAGADA